MVADELQLIGLAVSLPLQAALGAARCALTRALTHADGTHAGPGLLLSAEQLLVAVI